MYNKGIKDNKDNKANKDNKDLMIILRNNIYNCLIDNNAMKKLAEDTFTNVLATKSKDYLFTENLISIEEVRDLVQRFTMLINRKNIFTEQEIDTIYKECLVKNAESLNQDDFTVFFQIFFELLYELTTPKNYDED